MNTVQSDLTKIFIYSAQKAFPDLSEDTICSAMQITSATQRQFGHYQCNIAMRLAKPLKKNPRKIAEALLAHVPEEKIEKLEIAGPGFINIWLKKSFLSDAVQKMLDKHLGIMPPEKKLRLVVDLSSPNVAKEMHVGHLRSTIIGDALANLFSFLGHDVIRLNHIGDWGTQFGMLIAYIKEEEKLEQLSSDKSACQQELTDWYKAAKARFDQDADFQKRAQKEVVALQSGDQQAINIWKRIVAISEASYQEIYQILGVDLQNRGESFYNNRLPGLVKDLKDREIATISDGALCIFLDGFTNRDGNPLPFMIQKSDGGFGYATTDMAALQQRVHEEKADRILYLVDNGQGQHFQMLFQAAAKAGYVDLVKTCLNHVPFGLVLGPDGKRFRSRSGDTEPLKGLLDTAVTKAKEILLERDPDQLNIDTQAKALGIAAIKYADLSCNRVGDYTFSYDKMLQFEGNTAAFMMYSYVRVNGIKKRVGKDIEQLLEQGEKIVIVEPSEVDLALDLLRFKEVLLEMEQELLPNRLCDYLFGLAQAFNAFFRDCRVEGSEWESSRLLLAEVTARVFRAGFSILGLPVVERM